MARKFIVSFFLAVVLCSVFSARESKTMGVEVAEITSVTETTTVVETTTEPIETTTEPQTKTMLVDATAYCSCAKCCGKSDGITASGVKAKANHTIAVDKRIIPLGTKVLINGKQYVAEDTGSAIVGKRIDIYFDSHEQALKWGRQQIEIEVLLYA
jgi:3D (Asp-Asp-Asp) domain-containing protein